MRHYRKASLPNLTREVWCDNCELHPLLTTPDAKHTHTHTHTHACTPLQESLHKPTKVPKFQTNFILWPVLTRWRVSPNNTGLRNALRQARWIHSENYWRAFPSLSDANPVRAIMFQAVRITYWCQDCFAPRGHKAEHCRSQDNYVRTP